MPVRPLSKATFFELEARPRDPLPPKPDPNWFVDPHEFIYLREPTGWLDSIALNQSIIRKMKEAKRLGVEYHGIKPGRFQTKGNVPKGK